MLLTSEFSSVGYIRFLENFVVSRCFCFRKEEKKVFSLVRQIFQNVKVQSNLNFEFDP